MGMGMGMMRRLSSALLLSLTAVGASPAWADGCSITTMEIPVRIIDSRPIATLKLNGTDVPMLVDSGAFFSMLSASTATQLNLPTRSLPAGYRIQGYTGRIEARRTKVEKVGLVGSELSNIEFIVGGNELGAGIMGILGRNILSVADTEYDLAHGVVRLVFPQGDCKKSNLAYWAGDAPVILADMETPSHRGETAIKVPVSINGRSVVALMDTGAPRTALSWRSARRAGIEEADMKPAGRTGGAGAGRVSTWISQVALFEFGGEKVANNTLYIDQTESAEHGMLLGLDYFLAHRIYVSRLQDKVYATWNGGPVFARGAATAGDYDPRYAAIPKDVAANDADGLARRGAAATAVGDHKRALVDLNRACELAPGVADYFFIRARVHQALRQSALALADLDEALRLDPSLAEARSRRAWLRAAKNDRAGAQADLAELDAALPPSAHARAEMASVYAHFNQVPEALRQYELWIGTHPSDMRLADAYNGRCWLRARMGLDLPLAVEDCQRAVDKDGGSPVYKDSLGWAYLRVGDAARAKKAFDASIELQPLAFALYGRSLAQQRLNEADKARGDLDAARKLNPRIEDEARKAGFDLAEGGAGKGAGS
ncbi:hypothetical protein CDN99_00655 [Roseateles aquatilis]|uniref:Peptidase A2 domain-containing protein n=1 Tax=Roseateles aquatilis TaxID=431061 RepID=A0A246JKI9_9BURK|nr:aspartyl protease family protein [Roseateles aquatilis]OWQ93050.1 hypothetical protein CDN99_00655 [Roseateles aquatilis]